MRVIIMAAGRASRIAKETGGMHKCLIEYQGETIIFRLLRQLIQAGFIDINVVCGYQMDKVVEATSLIQGINYIENADYATDKNIFSLIKGYPEIDVPILIVEGDIILSEKVVPLLREINQKNGMKMIWSVNGLFNDQLSGAIVLAKEDGSVLDVKYVTEYSEKYKTYYKNLGILYVPLNQISCYRELLAQYLAKSSQYYFIDPLMDHLEQFDAEILNFGYENAGSFNTFSELTSLVERLNEAPIMEASQKLISLSDVDKLCHIEGYDDERVEWLTNEIIKDGVWTVPLCVDSSIGAVMDGQHRLEVAKRLNLSKIPTISFNYDEVVVWTLRPGEYDVNANDILNRAKSGNIYPYKTAKHEFPIKIPRCQIPLSTLMR